MKRLDINDDELIELYNNGTPMPELEKRFDAGHTVLYRHLKNREVERNRKAPLPWTLIEEQQLVAARKANCTGQEYATWIPTRSVAASKAHINVMRRRKEIER